MRLRSNTLQYTIIPIPSTYPIPSPLQYTAVVVVAVDDDMQHNWEFQILFFPLLFSLLLSSLMVHLPFSSAMQLLPLRLTLICNNFHDPLPIPSIPLPQSFSLLFFPHFILHGRGSLRGCTHRGNRLLLTLEGWCIHDSLQKRDSLTTVSLSPSTVP